MKKPFDRIIIVMFENQYRSYVLQNSFMRKLASAGAEMGNYFGAFHPSQTNYLASLTGEVCAVSNDTPPASPLMQKTLVDLLEPAGVSWKAYMEGYPGDPWNPAWKNSEYPSKLQPLNEFPNDGKSLATYFRKHNAFASFHTIQADEVRWNKIVDDGQFWKDLDAGSLPEFSWFTPDIWNDGHYRYGTHVDTDPRTELIPQLSCWLEYVFFADIAADNVQGGVQTGVSNLGLNLDIDMLLTDPKMAWANSRVPEGTLIVVTFDEADFDAVGYDTSYEGPNQVYTVLLGDMIQPGTTYNVPHNHYSLIKTIEKNYGLGDLGKNDKDANWFRFLWDEKFAWSPATDTQLSGFGDLAVAELNMEFYLLFQDANGSIMQSQLTDNAWSTAQGTGLTGYGPLALAVVDDTLHLVFTDKNGALQTTTSCGLCDWTAPAELGPSTSGAIAITAYLDEADQSQKMMLCWQGENGFIQFMVYAGAAWQDAIGEVGQLTDGPMSLRQMGPSLFLVYKERNSRKMRLTSYNVAPYNAFKALAFDGSAAPNNDTSIHQWSPGDMSVGHFAKKMGSLQNDYQSLGTMAMATIKGEMHLIHRGAYQDTTSAYTEVFGLTGIFTAANQMTNGYGTIDQTGWTLEQELASVQLDVESPIAMASNGQQLMVVWQGSGGNGLQWMVGGYGAL